MTQVDEANPILADRWARYLEFARRQSGDNWVIWSELIQEFPSSSESLNDLESKVEKGARGYSYVARKGLQSDALYGLNVFLGSSEYWIRRAAPVIFAVWRRVLKAFTLVSSRALRIHPSNVYDNRVYMVRRAALKEGLDLRRPLSLFKDPRLRPNYSTLKIFYYFERYRRHFPAPRKQLRVLEIGAGAANFPILFAKHYPGVAYFIIDLPGMILTGSSQLARFLPDVRQILPHEASQESIESALGQPGSIFVLLTPAQIDLVPNSAMDLAVNMESFAEMEPEVSAGYLNTIYEKLGPAGTLFLVNRESRIVRREGDVEHVTSFWKYPTRSDDEVSVCRRCPMRDLMSFGRTPNIVYVARTAVREK